MKVYAFVTSMITFSDEADIQAVAEIVEYNNNKKGEQSQHYRT